MSPNQEKVYIIYAHDSHQADAPMLVQALGSDVESRSIKGILKAKDAIENEPQSPKYIVIDIGGHDTSVLEELDMLAQVCTPSTRVVVMGSVNDIGFYRALMDRGVLEYYPYPCDYAQIAAALQKERIEAAPVMSESASGKSGLAVGFMSAASGDGSSTLALNTAYLLAEQFNHSVVLVDLDYQFGMAARQLDLKAPYGVRELLSNPDRGVDAALLNKVMVPYGSRLKIIAAPSELLELPRVRPEQMTELVNVLRAQFDFVIFDMQRVWVDWISSLMSQLDHRMLVSQLWLRSLTHVTRMMACWGELGIHADDVSLVMNRSGSRFKEAMSAEDFERISGLSTKFYLPNDTRTTATAEDQGKTIIEIGDSELNSKINVIAGYLHAQYTGQEFKSEDSGKKKGLLGFLN